MTHIVRWYNSLSMADVALVGGKNASLGEMISALDALNVKVPNGFATTSDAYDLFLSENKLIDPINASLAALDINDLTSLNTVSHKIRSMIMDGHFSNHFIAEIQSAYQALVTSDAITVAVRSSATAEDLPEASFAGQQETFLNVTTFETVLDAIKKVYASLFNDRALVYRTHHGFEHTQVKISAGVQIMIRSDLAASGVMFSIDPETGFDGAVFVTSAYGLGESVVQGAINPDEFYVYKRNVLQQRPAVIRRRLGSKATKMIYADMGTQIVEVPETQRTCFSLDDNELCLLAEYAMAIEKHYQMPMDIEWAKDGLTGDLYIVQARPETVKSRKDACFIEHYSFKGPVPKAIVEGRSVGEKIGQGKAIILDHPSKMHQFIKGSVLVADMTDPDWEPIMKNAAAIVTNRGGRTCHAAIIARELGIPAVVGTHDATEVIANGEQVTVSCAEGESGYVYRGLIDFMIEKTSLKNKADLPVKILMNLGNPDRAYGYAKLPCEGVGLARLEFIISNMIGIHPKALIEFKNLDMDMQSLILNRVAPYTHDPKQFYIEKLVESVNTIASAFYPKPIIVRLSDFKSNEYASLLGGSLYEPTEENPMIGFRGASRYLSQSFKSCFKLECEAIKRSRELYGFDNVKIMIPFVRTLGEGRDVIALLKEFGLSSGHEGLEIYMMCELPSNAILAEAFLEYFDGFSIGSNDLTQLTLGLDRDSALIAERFDERDPAVKFLISKAVAACHSAGKYIGICGQAPSDYPEFSDWLIDMGIDSISLNPDSILPTYLRYA